MEQQKLLREIKFPWLLTYPKTNEVNAYIIHQSEAIPQIFRSAWNPRSLVFQTVQVGPRCFRGKLSGFLPAAPGLPGSHCQVSRLSSAGIEKVGLGMGGILVASQLVSKAKKYRTWSFVLGFGRFFFFFGGGGR